MSTNLASVAQAVTDTVPAVPFINWQYVYCWVISLFGEACASSTPEIPTVPVPGVEGVEAVGDAAAVASEPGFWSWLWPFGGGSEPTLPDAASSGASSGFDVISIIPDPIISVASFIWDVVSFLWSLFSLVSYSASLILLIAVVVALAGLAYIRVTEWSRYGTLPPRPSGKNYGWSRWQDLLDAAMTTEPKRWKDGILAADQMLGELLAKLGYLGGATSEQLRSVPDGAFVTLPQAWEAHRVRNFVAQRSSNFILTQREAFRVMKLYEQVFEEFDFI